MKTGTTLRTIVNILCFLLIVSSCKQNEISEPPHVTLADPANLQGETGVKITISATFNEDMNVNTINTSTFLVKEALTGTAVQGSVAYLDRKATFTPNIDLVKLTSYKAAITTGARSASGRQLAQDYNWTFETCHSPEVTSTKPGTDATCVNLNQPIVAFFNHDLKASTVNTSTFLLAAGSTAVDGSVTYNDSDHSATFTPTISLSPGQIYTATLTTGIFNNSDMHLEQDYIWSFTAFGPNCGEGQACGPLNIDLKTAGGYGILAGSGITNVGFSEIHDMNVGISPGFRSSVTGFPPALIFNGNLFAADDLAPPGSLVTQAQADLTSAYLVAQAATSPTPVVISADLGGRTLGPGIYTSASTMLLQSGDLTLDTGGSPCDSTSVWIFQVGSALTTVGGGGGNVILAGGAKANHVFWQVGSTATIGDGTSFKGTIMALTSITMGAGASAQGRLLARNGAVTLTSGNILTKP